jgi:aspartate-semialdehyde dehydrogenase
MSRGHHVAIVGATGLVGKEMRVILEERKFPISRLTLLASQRSAGEVQELYGEAHVVSALSDESFDGVEIALFSAGEDISRRYAPVAASAGAVVIDNSSAWRMDPDCPLVVPEVNLEETWNHKKGIIANPNCSTIQLVVALQPLHDAAVLSRVVVATYQSVSGMGAEALDELFAQSVSVINIRPLEAKVFGKQMAFNLLPHCGSIREEGWTTEEEKIIQETRKILDEPDLPVTATAVRVPVFIGHGEAVFVELESELSVQEARELWQNSPGVELLDDLESGEYPQPVAAAGKDAVLIGRIRKDPSVEHGLCFWVVADNLRKGAATNAVQIAEELVRGWEAGR